MLHMWDGVVMTDRLIRLGAVDTPLRLDGELVKCKRLLLGRRWWRVLVSLTPSKVLPHPRLGRLHAQRAAHLSRALYLVHSLVFVLCDLELGASNSEINESCVSLSALFSSAWLRPFVVPSPAYHRAVSRPLNVSFLFSSKLTL